jgi:hypothetical protein
VTTTVARAALALACMIVVVCLARAWQQTADPTYLAVGLFGAVAALGELTTILAAAL